MLCFSPPPVGRLREETLEILQHAVQPAAPQDAVHFVGVLHVVQRPLQDTQDSPEGVSYGGGWTQLVMLNLFGDYAVRVQNSPTWPVLVSKVVGFVETLNKRFPL